MTRKVTAEHLAALKKELGYNKDVQFINKTRGLSRKKRGKIKTHKDIIEDEKAFLKFARKHLHPYIMHYYEHYIAVDNRRAFRANIVRLLNIPSFDDMYAKYLQFEEKRKAEKEAYKEYMKKKNPTTLAEYTEAEDKFYQKRDKMIRKYQKRGFIYTDNAFIKVDLKDFTQKLIERHEEMRRDNEKLLKAFKKSTDGKDLPPHMKRAEELFEKVEKDIKKSTKRLTKGVTESDLQVGVRF